MVMEKTNDLLYCHKVATLVVYYFLFAAIVSMDDVAASVGFAGWAFAAMYDHALMASFTH